ncbi:hypothetical protein [Psychrobacillus sp. FSL K6-1464]|uniref:hypothetical protein n=1 Tax=Psychrobacillus sp. FSL K6-1464 TaxID=2921545 RepID=UPI0030F9E628
MSDELIIQIEHLLESIEKVQVKTYQLCQKMNLPKEKYDTRVICKGSLVQKAQQEDIAQIREVYSLLVNEEIVPLLLQNRLVLVQTLDKRVGPEFIGTTLNILREIYHDLLIDLQRNRIIGI